MFEYDAPHQHGIGFDAAQELPFGAFPEAGAHAVTAAPTEVIAGVLPVADRPGYRNDALLPVIAQGDEDMDHPGRGIVSRRTRLRPALRRRAGAVIAGRQAKQGKEYGPSQFHHLNGLPAKIMKTATQQYRGK